MRQGLRMLASVGMLMAASTTPDAVFAQKSGGTLKIGHFDSPASMSMLEESTVAVNRPTMGVFNNLVMFKQDEPQNTPESIVPELATEWRWSEEGTELTFPLHQGVKWHDGKPFTAADVKCTIDLLQAKAPEKLRINPRNRGSTTCRKCRQTAITRSPFTSSGRSLRWWQCSRQAGRRSIRVT